MSTENVVLLVIIAVGAAVGVLVQHWSLAPYRNRACQGRGWKQAYPEVPPSEVRKFLQTITDAFAISKKLRLKLSPQDKVMALYRAVTRGTVDALELETWVEDLKKRYGVDITPHWHEQITFGEVFTKVKSGVP